MKLKLDYETRSTCDLTQAGAYVYARHPSTRVLCAAYRIDMGEYKGRTAIWPAAAGHKIPPELHKALVNPACEIHAWNAQFERLITRHVLDYDLPLDRYRCTAALARARGLPGKLEDALDYLGAAPNLAEKRRGRQIMMKWCRPLPGGGWANDPEEYMDLLRYCIADVDSESMISDRLHPLLDWEQRDYVLTEMMNDRGLPIDVALAHAAASYGVEERQELAALLSYQTDGAITSISQHKRIKDWLKERLPPEVFAEFFTKYVPKKDKETGEYKQTFKESTDKAARADFLMSEAAKEADPEVVDVIEIIDDANKASVAKFARMEARAADNGRAEGAYICFGAIQTKRHSSTGVQVHNFPRAVPDDVEEAAQAVLDHAVEGKVMYVLSSLLRPTIKAPGGRTLVWGDWSSVEARGMPWLADCQWKLDLYRQGTDVYKHNAVHIFGTPYDKVEDDERQIGKVSELSLQFGGAKGALRAMGRNYGVSLEEGKAGMIVERWRAANRWAAEFSYSLYEAFMFTVQGYDTGHGPVDYEQIEPLLPGTVSIACRLPGEINLYYHGIQGAVAMKGARVDSWETSVTFQKSMPGGFRTERVWHGLLAENVTQALCAALLRDCVARVERGLSAGKIAATIVGHTHDEIVLEASLGHAKRASTLLSKEMLRVPKWLPGFPLGCEVKSGPRYVK